MNKNLEKFLKEINNGKIYGSNKKLATILKITEASVGQWIKGRNAPTEDNMQKIAKLFKKSIEEVREMFYDNCQKNFDNSGIVGNNNSNNNFNNSDIKDIKIQLQDHEIRLLKLENERLKKELEK